MLSRILKRLSIAWLGLLIAVDVFAAMTNEGPLGPEFWQIQLALTIPAILGFVLSWVFLPPSK